MRELILGGQRSGKSRRAEDVARHWLAGSPAHKVVLIATAQACDDEMTQRIARHQADRAARLPHMQLVQEPLNIGTALVAHSSPETLVVIDCLTLWLTNAMMPIQVENEKENKLPPHIIIDLIAMFSVALTECTGPVVIVSNEIGQGVIPMGCQVRAFVDALGRLHQDVALQCERVTLMVAGYPLAVKGAM
jgi:adenosylcobinamide kinase / adenosylcobinamide-phosphate guanylyltransferase